MEFHGLSERFLALCARSQIGLQDLLQTILQEAIIVTASDVGGGIFLSEWAGKEECPSVWIHEGRRVENPAMLKIWRENSRRTLGRGDGFGAIHGRRIEDGPGDRSCVCSGSRSSLRVPILDAERVLGEILVESSNTDEYQASAVHRLQTLAAEGAPSIYRILLRDRLAKKDANIDVIGSSRAFLEMERRIRQVAEHECDSVLVTGERGSGKELAAWSIHCWSGRREHSFVPVLSSSLTESLAADELFGHERHAFTGAARERVGKLAAGHKGTVFLDEIVDLSPSLQSMLLRFLERRNVSMILRHPPNEFNVVSGHFSVRVWKIGL